MTGRARAGRPGAGAPGAGDVPVSVVVPVRDRPGPLAECLAALAAAAPPGAEILVVDDASTEDVAAVARRYGARLLRLQPRQGPAAARNLGARAARGPVVLFVDADVVVRPSTIGHVLEALDRHPEVAALFGSYDAEPRAPGLVSQYRNLLHHFVHQRGRAEASTFWAGCGAVRRAVFDQVGGFDVGAFPRASVEDIDLGYRLGRAGHRIRLDPTLQVTHLKRWTLLSMLRCDFAERGWPWARLLLERPGLPRDLNLGREHRRSVVLVGLAGLALLGAAVRVELAAGAALALAGVLALNRDFWRFLVRQRGPAFAAACVPLHLLHYAAGGLAFAAAWLQTRVRPARRRALPTAAAGPAR